MAKIKQFCRIRCSYRPTVRNADRFAYNRRGEVSSATVAGELSAYAYDGIGNFTTVTGGTVTNVYAANELNQYEMVTSNDTTLEPTYTSNGELASFGPWTCAYDALSRLTAAYSNGTLVVSNRYDHLGRRVQKIAADGTHTFLYDGWRPVVETVARASGGADRIEYHWGKDLSGTLDGAAGVGGLLYVKRNGAIYVPFYDAFGNIMGYWDAQGCVVAEYVYDVFGRDVAQSGALDDTFAIRYSTKYYDVETGMYYYGKRYYMTSLCRWLTRDPIEEDGGVNLYGFCGNDGVSIDPFGLTKISVSRTIKAMDGGSVRRNFLEIGVTILEAPKKGNQLNFIQLKKPTGKQWTVDQNVGFGPYYYTYMEKSALSRAYNWKENEIKLYDAPGGAIDRKTDFYTAVVEIERHCRSVGKRKILCADTVTVLYAISWSFYPYSSDQYQFTKSKSPGGIRPILRQLINNNKWQTEFCSNTEVKVK